MRRNMIYPAQNETQALGQLTANVITPAGYKPIDQATVTISQPGRTTPIEVLTTDNSGQTPVIDLPTPPLDYSLSPDNPQPYSEYSVTVDAPGYERFIVTGSQILPNTTAIQDCAVLPLPPGVVAQQQIIINVNPHTLYAEFPPKIPEAEIKEGFEDGLIVLRTPVVPGTIVVHDGPPDDNLAKNYYVPFKDYIKNVASCEIYSTWPASTIQANILAILSFTLNRVFTEWYRGKGKTFQITSSTAYDQAFSYGRNKNKNIAAEVDSLFTNYISRPGLRQPLFTQYCDGNRVNCPTWLSQWGSKTLGDQGYTTINILRNYYGSDVFLKTAERVSGIPSSFPGRNLQVGSSGAAVRTIQEQLNAISNNFPAIPKVRVDGVYGQNTRTAVQAFQRIFNLPPNGIVDYPTWYSISDIFVAVKRLAA